ncbi:MAG: hypothetical protein M3126_00240 [Candidatus Eremiobacteraeota bacterium]|nr:hypothetical protein [Candidatus Eremiobacteraeota bacterium]
MPVEFGVFYTLVGRPGRCSAAANDLSAGGLRIVADEDLPAGSMLALQFSLPDDFLSSMTIDREVYEDTPFGKRLKSEKRHPHAFEEFGIDGKVLAPFFDLRMRKFAYGIAFVDVPEPVAEELQRFIHLWQLNQIRQRNLD